MVSTIEKHISKLESKSKIKTWFLHFLLWIQSFLFSLSLSKWGFEFLILIDIENSLAVQWLGLCTFTAVAQVQSLVGGLRSNKLHGVQKKKKK